MFYFLETYGCQLNVAESNALELQLKGAGIMPSSRPEDADYVILNTCSVRKSAENRIWGRLGYFGRLKKEVGLKIILTGCMAERLKDELKDDAPQVDAVIGTNEKSEIINFILSGSLPHLEKYTFLSSYYHEGEYSSYVPIMNGCNNFCAYCIVPYVRGREVSRPASDILKEVQTLDEKGVKEITLLGQNVNSYNHEGIHFPELLEAVAHSCNHIQWIRFESPHPKDFSDQLIHVIAKEEKVAKHIHLPVQSGNTRILQLMNRKTTREKLLSLIKKMREEIKGVTFATDVMVGFPSESEREYEDTLSLMEEMGNIEAFMYYFNVREGTPAAKMEDQIDEKEKVRRLEILIDEQLKRTSLIKSSRLPFDALVLVTGTTRDDKSKLLGRSEHNEMISFSPKLPHNEGDMVMVHAEALKGNTYLGVEI